MTINYLSIQNYKSLRNVEIRPSNLTILIGPNGAGKSNLASAFDFLSDLYQNGLEYAVAKKGGFENIAFRRIRRTKASLRFHVEASLSPIASRRVLFHRIFRYFREKLSDLPRFQIKITHVFEVKAGSQTLAADYQLVSETTKLDFFLREPFRGAKSTEGKRRLGVDSVASPYFSVTLDRQGPKLSAFCSNKKISEALADYVAGYNEFGLDDDHFDIFLRNIFPPITAELGSIAVHQFSPQISRAPGSPSPSPKLSGYGGNLPALVDWLQRHHKKAWNGVVHAMRDVVPDLEEITVGYLHTKQLGLFFKEQNSGRAWAAEDMSDGTIQTLAILTALADPRNSCIFIEEPENSVHPWIVRQIAAQLKRMSKISQIFVTTHSPLVLNVVDPKSVFVCHKGDGETSIAPLEALAPTVLSEWSDGVDRLFELLDTGCVPEAVPLPGAQS